MSGPTDEDMEHLLKQENIDTLTEVFAPLIQAAVHEAMAPIAGLSQLADELKQARDELQSARDELKQASGKFVTADEAKNIGVQIGAEIREPLSASIDRHMKEMSAEDEKRNQAFDTRIGEINGLVLNQGQELATLKALHDERHDKLDSRLSKVENDIKTGVAAVAKNSRTLSRAVGQWIAESRNKEAQTELELKRLDTARVQFEKEIRENMSETSNLRADVEGLRGDIGATIRPMQDTVRDLKPQVMSLNTRMVTAERTLGYVDRVAAGILWLFKTRTGNVVLAAICMLLFGFQILNAFFTYQFIQQMNN